MKADKLISKSFEKLLERGKARGFITHEELKKSLGKRNSTPESLEKAVLNIFDNLITLVKQKSDFKVKTKEEWKMENETKKILDKNIKLTATCVRVPVLVSHSEAVNVEFKKKFDIQQIRSTLMNSPSCKVIDQKKNGGYATPACCHEHHSCIP